MKASPQGFEAGAKFKIDAERGHYGNDYMSSKAITIERHGPTIVSTYSCYLVFFKDFATKLVSNYKRAAQIIVF